MGIELVGAEPSGGDLCLIEAAGAGDGQNKMLADAGQRRQCLLRGVCQGEGGGEPGVLGRHLAQAAVEGAGEGLSAGELPIAECQRLPAAQPCGGVRFRLLRPQIQRQGHVLTNGIAGDLEDGGAADAVLGEENFSVVLRQHLPAPPQSNAGGVFHALQGAGIGGIGLELHQRRGQSRAVVAQQGQPIRLSLQRQTQHIQHGIGGVGAGIQLAIGLLHRDKAQLVEKAQRFRHREGLQRRAAEVRVGSVVVSRGGMAVGEVAPALPLQQRHPVPGVGEGRQRRHQAGGPAADDADLTHGAVPPAACG